MEIGKHFFKNILQFSPDLENHIIDMITFSYHVEIDQ